MSQAVLAAVIASLMLAFEQRLDVGGVFDLFAFAVGPRVLGDQLGAIEYAHGAQRGAHREDFTHLGMWHRIVIEIKTDIRGFAHRHLNTLIGGKRIIRQP